MKQETATTLISALAQAIRVGMDAHTKLVAMEAAFKKHDPSFYEIYQDELEKAAKNPPYSFDLAGISALQSRLVQD